MNIVAKLFLLITTLSILVSCSHSNQRPEAVAANHEIRQDYFLMRSGDISRESIRKFGKAVRDIRNQSKASIFQTPWTLEGPLNVNGRVNVVAIHPSDSKTWLVGESTGGIFKTVNGGQTYYPVFDQFNYLSISEIVYHPTNPDIVFAGTGDENISGYPFSGDGIYKSIDGGENWQSFALQNMGIISTISIHPAHPDTMFVASMGVPFVADSLRGVFRTYDGGSSWQQVLLPDTTAGVIDLMIDYSNPQTIYAVGWNRVRTNNLSLAAGAESQLYVSRNGGNTWQISNITGTTSVNSRIGITQTASSGNRIYATVANAFYGLEGVYYSDNAAQTWQSINTQNISSVYANFGWYFGQIRVNPFNHNKIYLPGVSLYKYNIQSSSWSSITAFHVDNHDLDFISEDSLIAATDGGLFLSGDGGQSWSDIDNIPSTQYYRVAFNPNTAGEYWGGLQDNGTVKGNANTINTWNHMYGGDGFQVVFDRADNSIVYVETQNGGLVYLQNGLSMGYFDSGIDPTDRRSWDMPFINDKNNNFYTGTYRIYKNTNAPWDSWSVISPELTDIINNRYHVITALGVSEVKADFVYAGTSDGHVWRSTNAGNNWSEITHYLPDLYVTSVEASPDLPNNVYVAHSGYRDNNNLPHIHKSTDKGNSWSSIAGDLPNMAVNAVVILPHQNDSILFVATDGGVYGTVNGGTNWHRVGDNMPVVPVYDLVYDSLKRKLVAGTYARAMHSISIDSLLPHLINKIRTPIYSGDFNIYPNPTSDYLMVELENNTDYRVEIRNMEGKKIKQFEIKNRDRYRVDLTGLKPGLYFIGIEGEGNIFYRKVIKL